MKVLVVSRWLWEERHRNGDKPGFFGELFRAVAAQGIDLMILSQAMGTGLVPERHPVDGLNIHLFSRSLRKPSRWALDKILKPWGGYRKAATDAAIIRRFVHQHGPFDAIVAQCEEPDGLACALAVLGGGMPPLVTCVHDLRYKFRADGVKFIHKSSLGFVFKKSARVVANSEQTATWLHDEYAVPQAKIGQTRIHLTAPFLEEARQSTSTPLTGQRVLFLGALNQKKAPDVFLNAAILLARAIPSSSFDPSFVMVGPETSEDVTFRARLKELAATPELANRLEMPGRLEPAAVIDQIRRACVVVCPSRIETFSRTAIEALALGRPVIVTENTGAAHWVRTTGAGSVIKGGNARALAAAIQTWIARKDAPDGSAKIISELTAEKAADDLIREVKSMVAPTISL